MPWKEEKVENQRGRFVLKAMAEGSNISELCKEFGITRPTGYKWIQRYRQGGIRALEDEHRRPKEFPTVSSPDVVMEIVRIRGEHPTWGSRKIRYCLKREGVIEKPPVARTIDRILKRCGFVSPRSSKKRTILPEIEIIKPKAPNEVWTIDFKGWWLTRDGQRCEPLTIRDEYSRFIIGIFALRHTTYEVVKTCLIKCFERYGLPQYIRSDNGHPFISTQALCGLTRLSAWWIKLGITPNRIAVASPGMNGAHERMHRDMKRELQQNPAKNCVAEQKRFDLWSHEFNHLRPHDALGGEVPAEHYRASKKKYKSQQPVYQYPIDFLQRKVSRNGEFSWGGRYVGLSKSLAREQIGIEIVDSNTARVWYTDYCMGVSDPEFKTPIAPATQTLRRKDLLKAA